MTDSTNTSDTTHGPPQAYRDAVSAGINFAKSGQTWAEVYAQVAHAFPSELDKYDPIYWGTYLEGLHTGYVMGVCDSDRATQASITRKAHLAAMNNAAVSY